MNTADVLKAARELIIERGWWQFTAGGGLVGDLHGFCVAQALAKATENDHAALEPALTCLADATGVCLVYRWNDTRCGSFGGASFVCSVTTIGRDGAGMPTRNRAQPRGNVGPYKTRLCKRKCGATETKK